MLNDPQTRQLFQHRLELDMKGQTGKGHAPSPCMQIESLERSVEFDRILGSAQQGRTGIGYLRSKREQKPREKIISKMKQDAEAKRLIPLHDYKMQTPWLSWGLDTMMRKDLSWRAILNDYSQRLLKFLLNAQSNTLPSPDNLRRWNLKRNVPCGLCGFKEATLSHILAGCHWVRNSENKLNREDRYTWRHNNLIAHFAKVLRDHLSKNRSLKKLNQKLINFVPEGFKGKWRKSVWSNGWLCDADDWVSDFDLPDLHPIATPYVFPHAICPTPLKVDGYLASFSKRICIAMEFTAPMEENIDKWRNIKQQKYEELQREASKNNWLLKAIFIEIGARGWFRGPSFPLSELWDFYLSLRRSSVMN